tara:strand:+ start:1798 stop:1971 length:174 start_codon:yes stop_codon:yes gene_type:complete
MKKTMTPLEEYKFFQKLYGKYFTSQMFKDFKGYASVRKMNTFEEIKEELSSLESIED